MDTMAPGGLREVLEQEFREKGGGYLSPSTMFRTTTSCFLGRGNPQGQKGSPGQVQAVISSRVVRGRGGGGGKHRGRDLRSSGVAQQGVHQIWRRGGKGHLLSALFHAWVEEGNFCREQLREA